MAKSLNVCTRLHLQLQLKPKYWFNSKSVYETCKRYIPYDNPHWKNNFNRSCNNRFEVMPVIITFAGNPNNPKVSTGSHANTILIDHDEKVIEIFDPLSAERYSEFCDLELHDLLNKIYPNYEILYPEILCPYGPQIYEGSGTCVLWSLLYLFLRISCKNSTRNNIDTLFYDLYGAQKLGYFSQLFNRKSITARIQQLILGFGCYLEKLLLPLNLEPFYQYYTKTIRLLENTENNENEDISGNILSSYNLLLLQDYVYYLKKYKVYTPEIEDIITSNPFLYQQYLLND